MYMLLAETILSLDLVMIQRTHWILWKSFWENSSNILITVLSRAMNDDSEISETVEASPEEKHMHHKGPMPTFVIFLLFFNLVIPH